MHPLETSMTAIDIQQLCTAAKEQGVEIRVSPTGAVLIRPLDMERRTSTRKQTSQRQVYQEAIARERANQKAYARRRRDLLGSSAGWRALRSSILARDNHRCIYCGSNGDGWPLECDHIIAVTKGGKSTPDNLATACKSCNSSKRNSDLLTWKPRA